MTRFVLDASVALKWLLKEADSGPALTLRSEYRQQLHEFLAPETFVAEIAHALTRTERRGLIQPLQSVTFYSDIISTVPDLYAIVPLMPRAIELSSKLRVGVYDCIYVALAEREQCKVVTADQKMAKTFPQCSISLDSL